MCSTHYHDAILLKGQVHPEIGIQSLSNHPRADGKSHEVSWSTKYFWSVTAKHYNGSIHIVLCDVGTSCMEPFYVLFFVFLFETSPHLL